MEFDCLIYTHMGHHEAMQEKLNLSIRRFMLHYIDGSQSLNWIMMLVNDFHPVFFDNMILDPGHRFE